MKNVSIAPVRAEDAKSIAKLARVIWQNAYVGIITEQQIDYMLNERYDVARLLDELKMNDLWWDKAVLDGKIIAFASTFITENPVEMKLDKLYVDPQKQRCGLGEKMISHVSERALRYGCKILILAVNKQNSQAIAAYKKYGFNVREAVCIDIGGGFFMNDFIMERLLE